MKSTFQESRPGSRRGVALLGAVVAMAIISLLVATIGWRFATHRRHEMQRQLQIQATWLARAGVELAIAKILTDPDAYKGETVALIPDSQVRIKVEADPDKANTYHVTSEARYPAEGVRSVLRSTTRSLHRKVEAGVAQIEVVP